MSVRLLVSVRDAEESRAALDGGADIIDAKEPSAGALGPVGLFTLRSIVARVNGLRPVTAALGDAVDTSTLSRLAHEYAYAGASLVKIGFAGVASQRDAVALIAAARDGAAGRAGIIAAAYADAECVGSLDPRVIVDAAATAGAAGVLLDTANKQGPGLPGLLSAAALQAWVDTARDAGLLVALAGRLTLADLDAVLKVNADVIGVRGAACDNGRTGRVMADRVRALRSAALRRSVPSPAPDPAAACG